MLSHEEEEDPRTSATDALLNTFLPLIRYRLSLNVHNYSVLSLGLLGDGFKH